MQGDYLLGQIRSISCGPQLKSADSFVLNHVVHAAQLKVSLAGGKTTVSEVTSLAFKVPTSSFQVFRS